MALQMVPFSTILTDLAVALRDTGNSRWTAAEMRLALRNAMEELVSRVTIEDVYEGEFVGTERDYLLPDYIEEVLHVERHVENLSPVGIRDFSHKYSIGSNYIRFGRLQPDEAIMRITYRMKFQVPITTVANLTGSIDADDTTFPVATPYLYPIPGWLKLDNEVVFYSGNSASGLSGGIRGLMGTTAATHNASTTADPLIPHNAAMHRALLWGGQFYCHQMKLNDAPGSNTSLTLTLLNQAGPQWQLAKQAVTNVRGSKIITTSGLGGRRRQNPFLV